MSEKCYQPDDYDHLLELIENSPEDRKELRHLETCAECRAKLDQYRSFLSRDQVPEGADLADAHVRLGDFLEKEIGTSPGGAVQGPGQEPPRWGNLRRWSPVLVAASLVFVVLIANNRPDGRRDHTSGTVRELLAPTAALNTFEKAGTDGFVLTWTGPAEADGYQVVILNPSMSEIDRFDVDPSGEYQLRQADHVWLQEPGPFFWYMVAVKSGDEIARSTVRTLESDH